MPIRDFHAIPYYVTRAFTELPVIKVGAGVVAASVAYVFPEVGQQNSAVALFWLVILDWVTGIVASWKAGSSITSRRMANTGVKLVGYLSVGIVIGIACHVYNAVQAQPVMVSLVLGVFVSTEGLSVLENVTKMGIKVPASVSQMLKGKIEEANGPEAEEGSGIEAEAKTGA